MPPFVSGWWTDEKVQDTVDSRYVHSHLRPNEAEQLTKSVFGDLSDDTYLEWILTRAKRFFLTLVDAGVPDQIFGIIDDSYDDEDLPIPEDEVAALRLTLDPDRSLDRRFYKAQFKYLVRVVGDGEHIRYANEETLPVVPLNSKPSIGLSKDALDKVTLPSNPIVYARKRIKLVSRMTEEDTLAEIVNCKRYAHEHVLSVFGSYTSGDELFVLLTPAMDCTLKSFLSDAPKPFDLLTKSQRRRILLNWPHCVASGLAWLHHNGRHHGCIRPSRLQIDERFQISLGQLDGDGILGSSTVKDDIEAYQYAAPERWKRSVTVQSTGNTRTALPSGGRTGRKLMLGGNDGGSTNSGSDSSGRVKLGPDTMRPTSTSYAFLPTAKGNFSRLRIGMTSDERAIQSPTERTSSDRQGTSRQSNRTIRSSDTVRRNTNDITRDEEAAERSSNHSGGSGRFNRTKINPVFVAAPELRTAVVQTWASAQHDMLAADVFALGSVVMDILTVLCKYSVSAFAKHRGSKNRMAGRGGGLADASFHANLVAVAAWAQMLHKDAEKRIKKEDGNVFKAVGPILQVNMQCLEREPSHRMSAEELARKLEEHIRDFADIKNPHCTLDLDPQERPRTADRKEARSAPKLNHRKTNKTEEEVKKTPEERPAAVTRMYSDDATPAITPLSPVSKQFFKFDFDARSETMVDDRSFDSGALSGGTYYASDGTDGAGHELAQALKNMSYRSKRVSWDIPEEDMPRLESPSDNGSFRTVSSPVSADQLRLPSKDNRNSIQFPSPPTQSPTCELPPLPPQNSLRRPPRVTSGKSTSSRASRLGIFPSPNATPRLDDRRPYV